MADYSFTVNSILEKVAGKTNTIKGKEVGEGIITVTSGTFSKNFKINVIPAVIADKIFIDVDGMYNQGLGSVMGSKESDVFDAKLAFNIIRTDDVDGYVYKFNAKHKFENKNIEFVYGGYLAIDRDIYDNLPTGDGTVIAGFVYRTKYLEDITSGENGDDTIADIINNNGAVVYTKSNIEDMITNGNMSQKLDVLTNRYIFKFNLDLDIIASENHDDIKDLAIAYNTDLASVERQLCKVEILVTHTDAILSTPDSNMILTIDETSDMLSGNPSEMSELK